MLILAHAAAASCRLQPFFAGGVWTLLAGLRHSDVAGVEVASILRSRHSSPARCFGSIIHILWLGAKRDGVWLLLIAAAVAPTRLALDLGLSGADPYRSVFFCSIPRRPCTTSCASTGPSSTGRRPFPNSRVTRRVRHAHTHALHGHAAVCFCPRTFLEFSSPPTWNY